MIRGLIEHTGESSSQGEQQDAQSTIKDAEVQEKSIEETGKNDKPSESESQQSPDKETINEENGDPINNESNNQNLQKIKIISRICKICRRIMKKK